MDISKINDADWTKKKNIFEVEQGFYHIEMDISKSGLRYHLSFENKNTGNIEYLNWSPNFDLLIRYVEMLEKLRKVLLYA